MKSKILNMIGTNTLQKDNKPLTKYMNKYISLSTVPLNRVSYDGTMTNITTTEIANYPITNTKNNYSIYKEAKLNYTALTSAGFTQNFTGITTTPFALSSLISADRQVNNITILLNKDDKTYMNNLKTKNGLGLVIVFRRYAAETSATTYNFFISLQGNGIEIRKQDTTLIYSSANYYVDLENGIINIGEELIYKVFGTASIDLYDLDYIIDIYLTASGLTAANIIPFQFSKIFIGHSFDFYANEAVDFVLKDLNVYTQSKRTGFTTLQQNNTVKSLKLDFKTLYSEELLDIMYNIIKINRNTPFIVLPYNNYTEYPSVGSEPFTAESKKWQKLNYEMGGLYYIQNDFKIKNPEYDVWDTEIDLLEYK